MVGKASDIELPVIQSQEAKKKRILELKAQLGNRLVILGHHYQRDDIIEISDFRGDSYGLARQAIGLRETEYIVFCGVRFMAESAEILARPGQAVFHPNPHAGCPLADMADVFQVERVWRELENVLGGKKILPVTYVNSGADLKAFCGLHDGIVCTSGNADSVFDWAFERAPVLFFFPDQHLGRNTAKKKGVDRERILLWDPEISLGGNREEEIRAARVILWKGHCHVHTWFRPEHVRAAKERDPQAKIVVHPECEEEVVDLADAAGSTAFIVRYVEEAPPGEAIYVGTEGNLVARLARKWPQKRILPLTRSLCPNMYKINLTNVLETLERLPQKNRVFVPEEIKVHARVALKRMLAVT
jgi:quinolinate synthase